MSLKDCFIEFEFSSLERFHMLVKLCEALRQARLESDFKSESYWQGLIDEQIRQQFTDLSKDQAKHTWERWLFEDVLFMLFEGVEYVIDQCREVAPNLGRIEFAVYSYPYGGADCLIGLITGFGFKVTQQNT